MTYFSLLTRMQKKASRQKVFRMISSAPDLKHILQKLNILGQRQIIQPVPVVSDCLGHFVPIYSTSLTRLALNIILSPSSSQPFGTEIRLQVNAIINMLTILRISLNLRQSCPDEAQIFSLIGKIPLTIKPKLLLLDHTS